MDNGREFVKVYNVTNSSGSNLTVLTEKSSQICRVCLKWGNIPIFGDSNHKNLSNNFEIITSVVINVNDEFPKYLCKSCNILLEGAILLRENAKKTIESLIRIQKSITKDFSHTASIDTSQNFDHNYFKKLGNLKHDSNPDVETELFYDHLPPQTSNEKDVNTNSIDPHLVDNQYYDKPVRAIHHVKELTKKFMKCPLCPKMLRYCDVIKHVNSHPENADTRCICCFCQKSYKKSNYEGHIRQHILEHNFVCDHCGLKVLGRRNFILHFRTHVNEYPYTCTECPYQGKTLTALRNHERMHEEPGYICTDCGKKFRLRPNLRKHMLLHKPEFRYKCNICDKQFYYNSDLIKHNKLDHLGIKDHVCSICGSAFAIKKLLRYHEKRVHNIKNNFRGRIPDYLKSTAENKRKAGLELEVNIETNDESFSGDNDTTESEINIDHDFDDHYVDNEIIVSTE